MINQTRVGMQLLEWKANFLAQWCETFGSLSEALEHYENTLALRTTIDPFPTARQSSLLLSIGRVRRSIGLNEEAAASFSHAFTIAEAVSNEANSHQAMCLFELSSALADHGCKLGAMRTLVKAERIIDQSTERNSSLHVVILYGLVRLFKDERCAIESQIEKWLLKAQIINDAISTGYDWQWNNFGRFV